MYTTSDMNIFKNINLLNPEYRDNKQAYQDVDLRGCCKFIEG